MGKTTTIKYKIFILFKISDILKLIILSIASALLSWPNAINLSIDLKSPNTRLCSGIYWLKNNK